MEEPQLTEEQMEDAIEEARDEQEDQMEDQGELTQEMQELYGAPTPEERHNQWTLLMGALRSDDTVRTTYLSKSELGMPLFSVRFLLDMKALCLHYKAERIALYFFNKIQNITSSGMSNEGFTMHLNVTQRREATKRRIKEVRDGKNTSKAKF